MAERIQQVEQQRLKVRQAVEPARHLFRQLPPGLIGIFRSGYPPIQAGQGAFALAHLGKDVAVFFLHIGKQFRLRRDVAVFRPF